MEQVVQLGQFSLHELYIRRLSLSDGHMSSVWWQCQSRNG